jgi:hypothetical protein
LGHVYVETATGERVLDVHPAAQQELVLRVPAGRPVFIRHDDDDGRELVLEAEGPAQVSSLSAQPSSVSRRDAAHLAFEELFAVPFGAASVRDYGKRWTAGPPGLIEPAAGPAPGATRATVRGVAGGAAIAASVLAVGTSALWLQQFLAGQSASQAERVRINHRLRDLAIGGSVLGTVAVASGAAWFALRDRDPPTPDEVAVGVLVAGPTGPGIGLTLGRSW